MTGRELLEHQLKVKYKYSTIPKTLDKVLEIIADNMNVLDVWRQEQHIEYLKERTKELEKENSRLYEKIGTKKFKYEQLEEAYRYLQEEIEKQVHEAEEYIRKLNDALLNCDTDTGKDALRAAQMYANTVEVNTVYDNTAFIVGLAAILSGNHINAVDEIKKINPDLNLRIDDAGRIKINAKKILSNIAGD